MQSTWFFCNGALFVLAPKWKSFSVWRCFLYFRIQLVRFLVQYRSLTCNFYTSHVVDPFFPDGLNLHTAQSLHINSTSSYFTSTVQYCTVLDFAICRKNLIYTTRFSILPLFPVCFMFHDFDLPVFSVEKKGKIKNRGIKYAVTGKLTYRTIGYIYWPIY